MVSKISWFVPIAVSILGVGASLTPVTAQTTFDYSATFDGISLRSLIPPDIAEISYEGESDDASLGLNQLNALLYSQVDPTTGEAILNTNPNIFGVDRPNGSFVLQGNGDDKIFASVDSTGLVNFETGIETLTGTVNILGGEGRFSDAQGSLSLGGTVVIDLEPNVPEPTQITVNGSFTVSKSVPEPSTLVTLIGLGVTGASAMFKRHLI
ncbi:hypothetical protein IQ247_19280 [Plectonema cf. radiosum LEGE 06105]|uniref:Ice-binding protein C-terminal domain-containing protein n=1 Tax=Plectonema cf. radiosum LEGE 06105 TaxID=945769 RepID=A0A8J7K1L1_9CYAN|nr:PEP-CTERM sorting domain-containing protein [Plectonema radiosum]MBE9214786.1 hypothetical protein [Plectonema cf. radiosum LEGE 06105]